MSDLDTDYKKLSKELLKVKVYPTEPCYIYTNVNDMIIFDWSKLILSIIHKYPHIYSKLMDNVSQQPNYIDNLHNNCILSNIQLFLPKNYDFLKKEIISIWINKYKSHLHSIYIEDKMDLLMWSEFTSLDLGVKPRMKKISEIIKTIDDYVLINSNNTDDDGN